MRRQSSRQGQTAGSSPIHLFTARRLSRTSRALRSRERKSSCPMSAIGFECGGLTPSPCFERRTLGSTGRDTPTRESAARLHAVAARGRCSGKLTEDGGNLRRYVADHAHYFQRGRRTTRRLRPGQPGHLLVDAAFGIAPACSEANDIRLIGRSTPPGPDKSTRCRVPAAEQQTIVASPELYPARPGDGRDEVDWKRMWGAMRSSLHSAALICIGPSRLNSCEQTPAEYCGGLSDAPNGRSAATRKQAPIGGCFGPVSMRACE